MILIRSHLSALILLVIVVSTTLPVRAQSNTGTASASSTIFIPMISTSLPPNPFGFDLRLNSSDGVLKYGAETRPQWARAGDVVWSNVELQRGIYTWDALDGFEANVRRIRDAGIEPIGVIVRTPTWAQSTPNRFCSPPKPEALDDFARFATALAARYSSGPLAVNYWEIWNEPDVPVNATSDDTGMGCWADPAKPDGGGAYYGEAVKHVSPAIKAANPRAYVLAGSLLYGWPDDSLSQKFLKGFLSSGAGNSFDALSFHAYGNYGAADLLLVKTLRIRETLGAYGLAQKPLFATEIAAMCPTNDPKSCQPNYSNWLDHQANFAARIYAQALALELRGALWYTLTIENPGFRFSHLIDEQNAQITPRPAYYAFRNSARLLQGAKYVGAPLKAPTSDQMTEVQKLQFRKARSNLYVFWVPQLDFPKTGHPLNVQPGATAICTQLLDLEQPRSVNCSDTNKDGIIWLAVTSLPQYVEVFDPQ